MDCGPTCLRMVLRHYNRKVPIQKLRAMCYINRGGVNMLALSEAAEKLGMRTTGVRLNIERLNEVELPCILHWHKNHFVVLYKITQSAPSLKLWRTKKAMADGSKRTYYLADPGAGLFSLDEATFKKHWYSHKETSEGISLLLTPSPLFYEQEDEKGETKISWLTILRYFYAYKTLFIQLAFGMGIGTLLSLVTPFLTQSIVDIGINTRNISFVYLILIAQVMLFIGSTSVGFIRSWILLHISTRINISILTDFLIKLMKLPVSFFESKTTGDIMQRMNDQARIESFLTGTTLNTLFSIINLVVFTFVLVYYNAVIFAVSFSFTLLYAGWITLFLKRRRALNYKQFDNSSSNQSNIVELVNGMQEIKLNNCEKQKRWGWSIYRRGCLNLKCKTWPLASTSRAARHSSTRPKTYSLPF
jgi:ATP-binding cassette subfamily B protein